MGIEGGTRSNLGAMALWGALLASTGCDEGTEPPAPLHGAAPSPTTLAAPAPACAVRQEAAFTGHTGYVHAARISPSGRWALSNDRDRRIVLHDVTDGLAEIATMQIDRDDGRPFAIDWAPDGRHALLGLSTNLVLLVAVDPQARSVVEVDRIALGQQQSYVLDWSPDGRKAALGSWDAAVFVVAFDAGAESIYAIAPTARVDGAVTATAWSPDGQILAVGTWNGSIVLMHHDEPMHVLSVLTHEATDLGVIQPLVWSPDGRSLAAGGWESAQVGLFEVDRTDPQGPALVMTDAYEGHPTPVSAVAWSPDGRTIASAGHDDAIHVLAVDRGRLSRRTTYAGHERGVHYVEFHPDGRHLLSAGSGLDAEVELLTVACD